MQEEKVIPMPGIQPQDFVNLEAADELQIIVDKLRSGESVGMAYVRMDEKGSSSFGWNVPNRMGSHIFVGVSRLAHALMIAGTKWEAE